VSDLDAAAERRVSPVELFFDLVFVFAFTQVTTLWLDQPSWGGFGRGLLVLLVLWWVWASFAWLTNSANVEADLVLLAMLFATAALFIAALTVPEAFGEQRLAFGLALFVVVLSFVVLYALVSKDQPDQLAAVLRMARTVVPGAALILGASFVPVGIQPLLWAVGFTVGFFGPNLGGLGGWRVNPSYFAERYSLIFIIALGESLGAIGFGARGTHLSVGVIGAAVLGLMVVASFWLAYFDFAYRGLEHLIVGHRGARRIALARDAYTYLHFPMVLGVLLFAFAMRTALADVGAPLSIIAAVALSCSSAIYLLAFVALRWRATRTFGYGRFIAGLAFGVLTVAAISIPALLAVASVVGVWLVLHAYELIWWRESRVRERETSVAAQRSPATQPR
jgi:low temperature requirement protein LtrA